MPAETGNASSFRAGARSVAITTTRVGCSWWAANDTRDSTNLRPDDVPDAYGLRVEEGVKVAQQGTEPEGVASLIYRALADGRHDDAVELAEANWPALITHDVAALRAVADNLSAAELAIRPAWDRIRRYLSYMMLSSSLRPAAYVEAALPHPPHSLADVLLTLTTRGIAARTAGHFAEAAQLARTALDRLSEARAEERDAFQHRLADGYLQWGLSFEFASSEMEALGALQRAYDLGVAFENTRVATEAAGEIAWIDAVAGRGNRSDKWLERAQELAASSRGIRGRRRTDLLAAALRAGDQLRPDAALEKLAARPEDAADEHRLMAEAQTMKFRFSAGRASATVLLSELKHAATSDAALLVEEGENFTVVSYIEALLHFYDGRPDRSIELLGRLGSGVGASYVIGTRAILQLAIGATVGAERDADEVVARFGQWPRQLIPALLVKAIIALERGDEALAVAEFTDACRLAVDSKLASALVVIPHADFRRLYALAGERVGDPEVDALLRTPLVFAPPRRAAVHLSPRESGVLKELALGGSLADVAGRLHLSVNTLKVHNHAIYRKLGADGRDHAVAIARERGII